MSDSTTELGLQLAVGGDDTADYLTIKLRQSLQSLDGTYNQASGHTHSGPHQGGLIASAAFGGPFDLPDWFRSTGQRSGFATSGQGLEMYWSGAAGVLQSYDRGANQYRNLILEGATIHLARAGTDALVIDGSSNVIISGSVTIPQTQAYRLTTPAGAAQNVLQMTGDSGGWVEVQSGPAGFLVANNANTVRTMTVDNSGNLSITGNSQITGNVVAAQLQALNGNLYLGSAHLYDLGSGAMATGGGLSVTGAVNASGNATVQNNAANIVPYTVQGAVEHIEHGQFTINGVNNNTGANQSITFARAFASNPIVIISVGAVSGGDVQQWHAAAQNITTANFNARVFNTSGGTGNCQVYWLAMGN